MSFDSHPIHNHGAHGEFEGNNTERNRVYFNNMAKQYDTIADSVLKVTKEASDAILEAYPFDPEKTIVMDFACGTGLISQNLAAHAKEITGVDISEKMVETYNEKVAQSSDPTLSQKMKAIVSDLQAGDDKLNDKKFDVIACSLAYHHFEDIQKMTNILVGYLKPGGALLVVDRIGADSSTETTDQHKHVVPHLEGFEEPAMMAVFESAGLSEYSYIKYGKFEMRGFKGDVFLAKGTKPIVL